MVLETNGYQERSRVSVCPQQKTRVDCQLWFLDDAGDGCVYICSKCDPVGRLVLDIEGAKTGKGASIIIYHRKDPERNCKDTELPANQKWRVQPDGTLVSALNNFVLDIKGAKREAGTPIITYPKKVSGQITNQLWTLEPAFASPMPHGGGYPSAPPAYPGPPGREVTVKVYHN